jgi:cation transporter-like permease
MGLLGLAPPGEDPWGPALAMICAGPVTALFYLPGCVAAAVASRRLGRDPEQAQVPLLVAAVLAAPLCGVGVALPVLLVVTRGDGDSPA